MPRLRRRISEGLHVIREALSACTHRQARARYRRLAVLWSTGRASDVAHSHVLCARLVEWSRRRGTILLSSRTTGAPGALDRPRRRGATARRAALAASSRCP
jgi:hypothetical protein